MEFCAFHVDAFDFQYKECLISIYNGMGWVKKLGLKLATASIYF